MFVGLLIVGGWLSDLSLWGISSSSLLLCLLLFSVTSLRHSLGSALDWLASQSAMLSRYL